MQKRIITGIIGIILLILIIYFLPIYFFYLLLFAVLLMSHYEFFNLFENFNLKYFLYSSFFSIFFLISFALSMNLAIYCLITLFVFSFCLFILSVKKSFSNINEILIFIISNVYISFFLCFSIPIIGNGEGKNLIMFILLIAWSTDSFAYFAGTKFGKNKLCPKISPNKTVEGAIGGIIGSLLVSLIFNFFVLKLPFLKIIFISFILSISCILGDLFESALKRYNNKKDSGNIFPGHGGMLDRIDSLFFAIPIFYILLGF